MPFERREDGDLGTHTVNLGSRQSERMIRVYNRRGFTRLEMELKDKRADLVAKELLASRRCFGVVRDCSGPSAGLREFRCRPGGREFTEGTGRAWATVTTPREITEERMTKWIEHQVAAALSVLHDIKPEGYFDDLIRLGRVKRRGAKRYRSLLSAGKPDADLQNEGSST